MCLPIAARSGTHCHVRIEPTLRRLAGRQHGLLTIAQVREHGWSRTAWYRACDAGLLVPLAPAVAALVGAPSTPEQRILAAILARKHPASASHRSAAYLWGVEIMGTDPVDIATDDRVCRLELPWVRTHNPRDLDDLRPVRRRGIPTTNPLRVLLDLGQVAPDAVLGTLEHFAVEGLVTGKAVRGALVRHGRKGRHGVGALRAAFDAFVVDGALPDSRLERAMSALLVAHGLPPALFHPRILGYEVDFAYLEDKVILECDGWANHGRDRRQFERDRERDAALVAAGWIVLHFTWAQITRRPAAVARSIRRVLDERSKAP
jgi:very-short-patch-repair endonuclease